MVIVMAHNVCRLKHLEMLLEMVSPHPNPTPTLEQYTIPADVAARILWIIDRKYDDIRGMRVLDFGCGTGRLAIGAALLGAKHVVGVDVDFSALKVALSNAERLNVSSIVDFIHAYIGRFSVHGDVVIQNPPFGVQRRGADRVFLKAAVKSAPIIYSLHKSGFEIRKFIFGFVEGLGGVVADIIPLTLEIPHLFDFHYKRRHVVKVDLYRIVLRGNIDSL